MQPEHSTWHHPKGRGWASLTKARPSRSEGFRFKLSGCSDAAPPVLAAMRAFKVWWQTPKKWESSTPSSHTRASDAVTYFFLFFSWSCVCIVTADPQQVGHRAHREPPDCWWEANNPPLPRAQLLPAAGDNQTLPGAFCSMLSGRRLKEQGLEPNPGLHYCLDTGINGQEGIQVSLGFCVFWEQ